MTPPAWSTDEAGAVTGQGGGGDRRCAKGEPHWCWTELRDEPGVREGPTARRGKAGWEKAWQQLSAGVGGGLGTHAAKEERAETVDREGRGRLYVEASGAIGLWIPRGFPVSSGATLGQMLRARE